MPTPLLQFSSPWRAAVLAALLLIAQLIGPPLIRIYVGDMRGSILPLFVMPAIGVILWLLFSAATLHTFWARQRPFASGAVCIGIGFLLSLVSTMLLWRRILPGGSYGPGP